MNLTQVRKILKSTYTGSELFIEEKYECVTLEDPVREVKIYGETAIPYGRYEFIINYSPRFKRRLPYFLNVPKFTDIRMHPGVTVAHTKGCVLPGERITAGMLWYSSRTMKELMIKFEERLHEVPSERFFIDITK